MWTSATISLSWSVNSSGHGAVGHDLGKVYAGRIEAGVQSIMIGHIMLPAYQEHFNPGMKGSDLLPGLFVQGS